MASCQVTYRDHEGIVHQIDVQAESLFEAVAVAVHQFRKTNWCGNPPGPGCNFNVKLLPETPAQTYTVSLSQVQDFARHGTAKGPKGFLKKNKFANCWASSIDRSTQRENTSHGRQPVVVFHFAS